MGAFIQALRTHLDSLIGRSTDAAGTGTLFARTRRIDETKIGTPTDTRASNTLFGHASSAIKSVQQVTILIPAYNSSATAAISSVNTAKAFVIFLGWGASVSTPNMLYYPRVTLGSTAVTAIRTSADLLGSTTVNAVVVELH